MDTVSSCRIAITGAAGFLGRRMVEVIGAQFPLKLLDIMPLEMKAESKVGDVANLEDALWLCEGCTDLIIGHMAPNQPGVYATPLQPFDINVKGTAQLFHAAKVHGIKRVVLISSISVVQADDAAGRYLTRDLPPSPLALYSLTKTLQEQIALFYHRTEGMEVAVLRPAYICDEDTVADKYGRQKPTVNWHFVDPRDIAEVARLSILAPKLGYEVFYVLGHPDAAMHAEVKHLTEFLGWTPRHTFEKYPRDGEVAGT